MSKSFKQLLSRERLESNDLVHEPVRIQSTMPVESFLDKIFVVEDADARVRQPSNLLTYVLYGAGDVLPVGKSIGEAKIIPKGTRLKITNAKSIDSKLTFVFVASAENDGVVYGCRNSVAGLIWTAPFFPNPR